MHGEFLGKEGKGKNPSKMKKSSTPPPKKVEHKLLPRDPMTGIHSQAGTHVIPVELLLGTLSHPFFPIFQLIVMVQCLHALGQTPLRK